jgi:hypothetical protein
MRIIFSGDTRWIRSVEVSDAVHVLKKGLSLDKCFSSRKRNGTAAIARQIQELPREPEGGFDSWNKLVLGVRLPGPTFYGRFNKPTQKLKLKSMREGNRTVR